MMNWHEVRYRDLKRGHAVRVNLFTAALSKLELCTYEDKMDMDLSDFPEYWMRYLEEWNWI